MQDEATKKTTTAEGDAAAALARLAELQAAVGKAEGRDCSDGEFARRFLPFSATTLSRMRSGTYRGDVAGVAEQCRQAAEEIEARLEALRRAAAADRAFVRTRLARATLAAAQKARDKRDRRVVVLLAPTGAGKTEVGRYLASRGAVYVEGRQSWQNSYKAFCADVAEAAGRPIRRKGFSERDAEAEMLAALRAKDGLLYIDEANTLGRSTANAIKLIANQTGYAVVIAAIPEMWDRFLEGAANEVRQVVNRCQPVLRAPSLQAEDVRPFLERAGLPPKDLDAAVAMAVEAANEFGALKTVAGLADALAETENPTIEDAKKHLGYHARNVEQSGIRTRKAVAA